MKDRSPHRVSGRRRKLQGPPEGEPWVWLTRELMCSAAFRARSVSLRRLIDFLLYEHMNHAGKENGNLKATHKQLQLWGVSKNCISNAIQEGIFLGLLRFERGGRWGMCKTPSLFRLTFLPDQNLSPPSNEWKSRTEAEIAQWKMERIARRKQS